MIHDPTSPPTTAHWTVDQPLGDVPAAVDTELVRFFADRHADYDSIDPVVADGVDVLELFVTGGGKRLRPLFAWAGARAALSGGGGSLDPATGPADLLRAVGSLEFIQACALIHDDIIDRSDTRRGRPTTHRWFEAFHRDHGWYGDAAGYGESQAILIGDLAFAWADDMFMDSGVDAAALARAREPWRRMRSEVIAGQMLDIALENSGSEDPTMSQKVNTYKTAAYTVERPLHLGATLGGADAATVDLLRTAGRDIGIAFQLKDDHLGVFGDPAVTGKAAGDDLRSGKRTWLVMCALASADRSDPATAARLRAGIGTVTSDAEVDDLRQIIVDSGAAEQNSARVRELTDHAVATLRSGHLDTGIVDEIVTVADHLTDRRS
ncbi:polyprenyl synthetase family protein [Corynebacterium terpenotabidum]|uniref:Geranylgeranyl pyrophosphate synthase n=1 Tax=Corynebacterium terpenotabidum Y-11 TaxID=1200352 RepID=S4XFY6_9CORY|nr:polyprenyl synthetase family protein [Corynebacterium terpenotabidum]AGP30570.1 Geranylgeranyl pyrophosphate synthase [Corynebacterium terpenotabidum Y-11]